MVTTRTPTENRLILPAREESPALDLCYFEWGQARAGEPSYLLSHATGFHARCWDQVIGYLPAGSHVIAPDMRGHGRSANTPPYHWHTFGDDLVALIDALDLHELIAGGHSMGGYATLRAAAARIDRIQRLLLVDPVVMAPEVYADAANRTPPDPEDNPVARRRARFDDWQAMHARFAEREPFSLWDPQVFEDYCRWGVLPDPEGGVTLACPPLVEATIYSGNTSDGVAHLLPRITRPVTVLRARQSAPDAEQIDFSRSPTWPGLAAALPDGHDLFLPELTHFIIMQAPALTARCLTEWISDRAPVEALLPA